MSALGHCFLDFSSPLAWTPVRTSCVLGVSVLDCGAAPSPPPSSSPLSGHCCRACAPPLCPGCGDGSCGPLCWVCCSVLGLCVEGEVAEEGLALAVGCRIRRTGSCFSVGSRTEGSSLGCSLRPHPPLGHGHTKVPERAQGRGPVFVCGFAPQLCGTGV